MEEISLSVEETNQLRISLGLKPLKESKTYVDREKEAVDNLSLYRQEQSKLEKRKELAQTIQKQKVAASRNLKLAGPTLSALSEEGDDALAWIKRMKAQESQKQQAIKKAKELDELDSNAKYESGMIFLLEFRKSRGDLSGLKVAHDIDDFVEGQETILVLKDSQILENDEQGDELLSINMADAARTKKNLENKKKRPGYVAYDDDEFQTPGVKRNILQQYDEEIMGPKETGFVLSKNGTAQGLKIDNKSVSEKLKEKSVSLDFEKNKEMQDYYTQEEMVTFKKPKKKKKPKNTRKPLNSSSNASLPNEKKEANDMDVDHASDSDHEREIDYSLSNKNKNLDDVNFVDDDDLQVALSRARKAATQKSALRSAEEIAKDILDQKSDDSEEDINGLVISDTSEFVRNLQNLPALDEPAEPTVKTEIKVERDVQPKIKKEVVDQDEPTQDSMEWEAILAEERLKKEEGEDSSDEDAGVEQEPLVSAGLGATLALLSQKGIVQKPSTEEQLRLQKIRERELWLVEERKKEKLRALEKEKERERNKAIGRRGSGRESERQREEEARRLERERIRLQEEKFKNYNPDIKIAYHDEFGRELNSKEAYKQLAHRFHGNMPGKKKTEKRLQRIQEEMQLRKLSSSGTSTAASELFSEAAKQTGSAHIQLSIGNRAAQLPAIKRPPAPAPAPAPTPAVKIEVMAPIHESVNTEAMINLEEKREKITFGFGIKRKAPDDKGNVSSKKAK